MIARDRFYSFCSVPTEKDILTTCRVLKTCCEASPLDVLFKIPLVSTHCVRGGSHQFCNNFRYVLSIDWSQVRWLQVHILGAFSTNARSSLLSWMKFSEFRDSTEGRIVNNRGDPLPLQACCQRALFLVVDLPTKSSHRQQLKCREKSIIGNSAVQNQPPITVSFLIYHKAWACITTCVTTTSMKK
ncbi:uncharacterized protein [Physcomitrium patens]|uniref:uncharacterized protein isoform X3 n=1 Tax=Physcomitrium patens TaxID=3218 RepID=UPI003CCD0013